MPSANRSSCTVGGSRQHLSGNENNGPLQADGLEPARDEPPKSAIFSSSCASSKKFFGLYRSEGYLRHAEAGRLQLPPGPIEVVVLQ